jgi:hypothetical protein
MYKFGKTLSSDILERFSVEHHERLKWRGIPLGRDYNIKVIWSMWVLKERADKAEEWFKQKYPKKFYCGINYNGITECRTWATQEHIEFMNLLYSSYPATDQYKAEISRLKMRGDITKTHNKVYYIMLNKKQ